MPRIRWIRIDGVIQETSQIRIVGRKTLPVSIPRVLWFWDKQFFIPISVPAGDPTGHPGPPTSSLLLLLLQLSSHELAAVRRYLTATPTSSLPAPPTPRWSASLTRTPTVRRVTSTFPKALSAKAAAMSALVISGESDKRTPGSSVAGTAGSSAPGSSAARTPGSSAAATAGSSAARTAGSPAAATAGSSRRKPKSQTQSALVGFSQY